MSEERFCAAFRPPPLLSGAATRSRMALYHTELDTFELGPQRGRGARSRASPPRRRSCRSGRYSSRPAAKRRRRLTRYHRPRVRRARAINAPPSVAERRGQRCRQRSDSRAASSGPAGQRRPSRRRRDRQRDEALPSWRALYALRGRRRRVLCLAVTTPCAAATTRREAVDDALAVLDVGVAAWIARSRVTAAEGRPAIFTECLFR